MAAGRRRHDYDVHAPLTWLMFCVHREAGTAAPRLETFHPLLPEPPKSLEQRVLESHPIFLM